MTARPTGNKPRLGPDPLIAAVNAAANAEEGPAHCAAARTEHGDDLVAVLEKVLGGSLDQHVLDYLEVFPHYVPVLLGMVDLVAVGGHRLRFDIVDDGPDLTITTVDDEVVLLLRGFDPA